MGEVVFKYNIGDNFTDERRDLIVLDRFTKLYSHKGYKERIYTQLKKYYICKCNKCGCKNVIIGESELGRGDGCGVCYGSRVVEGINDIPTTNPEIVKFFQGGIEEAKKYTKGSHKKIYPKCPTCGMISKKSIQICQIAMKNKITCICNDNISYPEKFMYNILTQLGIDFIYQANKNDIEWLNRAFRYDFYLNDYKIIIETDGGFHSKEDTIKRDKEKDILARNNNFKLIRIDCYKSDKNYIMNNILQSELNNYFDINNIDFDCADKYAKNNSLVVDIYNYYKNNNEPPIDVIRKYFRISHSTAIIYLNKIVDIGLMDGYKKYQHFKESDKTIKKTYMFDKSGNLIKEFISSRKCAEYLNKIYGCKIRTAQVVISKICNKKQQNKSYYGYTFSYENVEPKYKLNHFTKKVAMYNKENHELIKIFNSIVDANEYLGVNKDSRNISNCLNSKGKRNLAYGYIWEYVS